MEEGGSIVVLQDPMGGGGGGGGGGALAKLLKILEADRRLKCRLVSTKYWSRQRGPIDFLSKAG